MAEFKVAREIQRLGHCLWNVRLLPETLQMRTIYPQVLNIIIATGCPGSAYLSICMVRKETRCTGVGVPNDQLGYNAVYLLAFEQAMVIVGLTLIPLAGW